MASQNLPLNRTISRDSIVGYPSKLSFAVLVLLLACSLFGSAVAVDTLVRPNTVTFVYPANTYDPNWAISSLDRYYGLKAAEKYANDNDLLSGTTINVQFVTGLNTASDQTAVNTLIGTIAAMAPFGVVSPDLFSSGYIIPYLPSYIPGVPIINPQTTLLDVYTASTKNVIFLRQPFTVEHIGLLNYALNGVAQCSYVAVLTYVFPGSDMLVELINATLIQYGNPPILNLSVPAALLANPSGLAALIRTTYFQDYPVRVPGCAVFIGLGAHVARFIEALWSDPRLDRTGSYFFAPEAAADYVYQSTYFGTAPYANLRISTHMPKPIDASIPSVGIYQAARDAYAATSPTIPANLLANVSVATSTALGAAGAYSYASLSGFQDLMFAVTVLAGMQNLTRPEFVKAVYNRNYVRINETVVGPFNLQCLSGSPTAFPCFCNTGGRTFYMAQVNTSTAGLSAAVEDPVYKDAALLVTTASLQTCQLSTSSILYPLPLAMLFDSSSPMASDWTRFASSLRSSAQHISSSSLIGTKGRLNPFKFTFNSTVSALTAQKLGNLTLRHNPFLAAGGSLVGSTGTPGGIPTIFSDAVNFLEVDVPLTTASTYSTYALQLVPSIADLIHSLAQYATTATGSGGLGIADPASIFVAYDSVTLMTVTQQSLNTFQVAANQFTDLTGGAATSFSNYASSVVSRAAAGSKTVAFVASSNRSSLLLTIAALATAATTQLTTASQQQALIVMIGADPNGVYAAKQYLAQNSLAFPAPVGLWFGSAIREWWVASSQVYQGISTFQSTTNISVIEDPAVVMGFLAAAFLTTALPLVSGTVTATSFISSVYSSGTISSYGTTYGPFYASSCPVGVIASKSVSRTCQCPKGPRQFYVLSLQDWISLTSGASNNFVFAMTTCGVSYAPLATSSSLNIGMVAGAAAGGGSGVLIIFVGLFCFALSGKRDNSAAPKDPNKPFAIIFTDIQSSTSLWARAPKQMGPCVEKHHDEIRKLCKKFRGYEVKTIGDSFMIAFDDPKNAISLAIGIQDVFYALEWPPEIDATYRGLAQEAAEEAAAEGQKTVPTMQSYYEDDPNYRRNWNGLRVRVGLHYGMGSVKLDPISQGYDYYGTLVNTAARVEGVGNGGQVLVTKDMYDELESRGYDFSKVDVVPLGPQPLRGLDAPIPLYQLNPVSLKTRSFNSLRLDVENAVEEDSNTDESSTQNVETASSRFDSDGNLTQEQVAEKFVKSKKQPLKMVDVLLDKSQFFDIALSTSTESGKNDIINNLIKRWRLKVRRQLPHETKERYEIVKQLELVWKLVLAQEDVKKSTTVTANRGRRESTRIATDFHDEAPVDAMQAAAAHTPNEAPPSPRPQA